MQPRLTLAGAHLQRYTTGGETRGDLARVSAPVAIRGASVSARARERERQREGEAERGDWLQ